MVPSRYGIKKKTITFMKVYLLYPFDSICSNLMLNNNNIASLGGKY